MKEKFIQEIAEVINKNSLENDNNTPDFILAEYLYNCLWAFKKSIKDRDDWQTKIETGK